MKITRVENSPVKVPIRPAFLIRGSLGMHTESPFLLLRMHTDGGVTGLGEVSCTPVWSGEDQLTAAHIIADFLAPAVIGEDPRDIERLTAKMRRAVAGNPFTKSGMEMDCGTFSASPPAIRSIACWGARCARPCPPRCRCRVWSPRRRR